MKKIIPLLILTMIIFTGCNMFSSKKKMQEYINKLETTLKNDSLKFAASIEQMKSDMQHQLDSINAECGQQKGNYHIITGSFREQQNAVNFVNDMQKLGYKATIIDAPNGFHLVSISAGDNLKQMFSTLYNVRTNVNEESWIYIKN